ncbi:MULTISPECIES: hypothetical protein [unclassified Streptomyces]
MTAHVHPRPTTRLRQVLASLLRARRAPDGPEASGTPDVWLAGLRLGG